MSDYAIKGTYFAWVRGLKDSLIPTVFHEGILKSQLEHIFRKKHIEPQEAQLELKTLAERYPYHTMKEEQ